MAFSRIQSCELHNHVLQSLWIVLTDASNSLVRTERVFSFSSLSTTFSRLSFIITVTSLTICRTSCSLSFGSCRVSVGGSCTLSIRMFIFSCSESEKAMAVRFLLDRYMKKIDSKRKYYTSSSIYLYTTIKIAKCIKMVLQLTIASFRLSDCNGSNNTQKLSISSKRWKELRENTNSVKFDGEKAWQPTIFVQV